VRRKYPLGGRFVTEYEDIVEGQRVLKKGVCQLGWKRRDIRGKDTNFEEGRSWILDGRVDRSGYLGGRYRADDPYDSGTGTFFLKREGNIGDMSGLWAGYDSENHVVVSGSYKFYRSPNATVRLAQLDEAQRVVSLLGEALGESYVALADVQEAIATGSGSTCLVAVDLEGRLLGAATYYLVGKEEIFRFLPTGQEDIAQRLRLFGFNHSVGLLRNVAVAPSCRGRGVATQLTEAGIRWCAHKGATAMLAFAWNPPTGSQLAGVLEHTGFTVLARIDGYWTKDSQEKRYECPACGPICTCAAVVYSRALLDQTNHAPKRRRLLPLKDSPAAPVSSTPIDSGGGESPLAPGTGNALDVPTIPSM
jgi:GNAT superfamily N-acetyltransferase